MILSEAFRIASTAACSGRAEFTHHTQNGITAHASLWPGALLNGANIGSVLRQVSCEAVPQ